MTALERLRNACLDTALDYEAATEAVMKSSKHKHRQRKSLFQKRALRLKTGISNKAKLEAEIGKKAGDAEASFKLEARGTLKKHCNWRKAPGRGHHNSEDLLQLKQNWLTQK